MSNRLKKIFEEGECLSEELLVDYANDKLSNADRHRVEKHLLSCEMCEDTVSGLQVYATESRDSGRKLNELKEKVTGASTSSSGSSPFRWAAAAAIVLLLGWSYYLFNEQALKKNLIADLPKEKEVEKTEKSVDKKVETKTAEKKPVEHEQKKVDEVERTVPVTENNEAPLFDAVHEEEMETEEPLIAEAEDKRTVAASGESRMPADSNTLAALEAERDLDAASLADAESIYKNETGGAGAVSVATKEAEEQTGGYADENVAVEASSAEIAMKSKKAAKTTAQMPASAQRAREDQQATSPRMQEAMDLYDLKMYKTAASKFENIIETDPANLEAWLYAGLSRFNNKETEAALIYFNNVTEAGQSEHYETALWYKAIIFKKRGEEEKAIILFKKIREMKGKYSEEALKQLGSFDGLQKD